MKQIDKNEKKRKLNIDFIKKKIELKLKKY